MSQQEQLQADEYEISLLDILLFLIASGGNIVKSTLACLLAVSTYYFIVPKTYEFTVTIEIGKVAGELIEAPAVLLEKMKLPLYFSSVTYQACNTHSEPSSKDSLYNKIKPSLNKSAPFITFVYQGLSMKEGEACLSAVVSEVISSQDKIAKPIIEEKKQKIKQAMEQLKLAEEIARNFPLIKNNSNVSDKQFSVTALPMTFIYANANEISSLRSQINELEISLTWFKTRPVTIVAPVYSTGVPTNKRLASTLGLALALGVFLGLLVTGAVRVVPGIQRQMREAKVRRA